MNVSLLRTNHPLGKEASGILLTAILFLIHIPDGFPESLSLRLVGSDCSVVPTAEFNQANPSDLYPRELMFSNPDDKLTVTCNTGCVETRLPYVTINPGSMGYLTISTLNFAASLTHSEQCADDQMDSATASVQGAMVASISVFPSATTLDQAAEEFFEAQTHGMYGSPAAQEFVLPFRVKGGPFDGKILQLPAAMVFSTGDDAITTEGGLTVGGEACVAVDWGADPYGYHDFMLVSFTITATVSPGADCISVEDSCLANLSAATPSDYVKGLINNLAVQFSNGSAYFQGAIPEQLYLYDFSGRYTIPAIKSVPSAALSFVAANGSLAYPSFDGYINQYDAGIAFSLPAAGGNSCGPMALALELNSLNYPISNIGTLANGTAGPQGFFDYAKVQNYLPTIGVPQGELDSLSYFASWPVFFTGEFAARWRAIDSLVDAKQPVMVAVDFPSTVLNPSLGHLVTIFGEGHSDAVADLYGTSGDYYIVADPAQHFYAYPHSGKVTDLQALGYGINYGGWFAIYPKENLQQTFNFGLSGDRITAYTIGNHFPSTMQLSVSSGTRLALLVTDPFGNQTGIAADGTQLRNIPLSTYLPDIAFGDGGATTNLSGPQTVYVNEPVAGNYTITLIASNAASYTLNLQQTGTNGSVVLSNALSAAISTAGKTNVTITALVTGPPQLHFSSTGGILTLSWPTNYAGFSLQTSTNLGVPSAWQTATNAVTSIGGLNRATATFSGALRFYRLSH